MGPDLGDLRTEFRQAMREIEQVTDQLRATNRSLQQDLQGQHEELRRQRREAEGEYAEQARRGEAGQARRRLQERMDRGETTWRDVLSGRDDHWSAEDVREEIARDARQEIDRLELEDEEFRRTYRQDAVLRRGQETGEWRS